jgi:DNA-binding beta-propeller fold protein YncE
MNVARLSSLLLLLVLVPGRLPAQAATAEAEFDPIAGVWVAGPLDSALSPAGRASGPKGPAVQNLGGVEIVKSFPFPPGWLYGRDIAWDGASLWIGENFSSRIYEVDPNTGNVLSSFAGPNSNPWGLAFDGVNLLHATITLAGPPPDGLPDDVYVLTTQGGVLNSWLAPDSPNANAHGCAFDPATGSLWLSDSESDTIYELDPADGAIRSSFPAPGSEVRGLTFDGQNLWAIDYDSLSLMQFDFSGNIQYTVSIAALGNDPEGLEFDGSYL